MFSLVGILPSSRAAAPACCSVALFTGFIGTTTPSDSSPPFMPVLRPKPSPARLPLLTAPQRDSRWGRSPGSRTCRFLCVRGVFDYAGSRCGLALCPCSFRLPLLATRPASRLRFFEAQYPSPPMPLFTLRMPPRDDTRKTRGQDCLLFLSCRTLSFPTTCRFIPAHLPGTSFPQASGVRRVGLATGQWGG